MLSNFSTCSFASARFFRIYAIGAGIGGVASGGVVLKLPLDIASMPLAPKPNISARSQESPSSFFINASHSEIFGRADTAGGLKATSHAGSCAYFPDGAGHDEAHGQSGVGRLLARGLSLMKSRPPSWPRRCPRDIAQSQKISLCRESLHVSVAAGLFKRGTSSYSACHSPPKT